MNQLFLLHHFYLHHFYILKIVQKILLDIPSYYHCSELNFKNVQSLRPTRRVALLLLHSILQKYAICIYDICFDLFCIMVMGELIHRYSFY